MYVHITHSVKYYKLTRYLVRVCVLHHTVRLILPLFKVYHFYPLFSGHAVYAVIF